MTFFSDLALKPATELNYREYLILKIAQGIAANAGFAEYLESDKERLSEVVVSFAEDLILELSTRMQQVDDEENDKV